MCDHRECEKDDLGSSFGEGGGESDSLQDLEQADEADEAGELWETEQPMSIFTTADKRRLFIVEEIIKACAGCRPSFLFTGYVVEHAHDNDPSPLRMVKSEEKTIERDLTLSLRYEPPSPKFSRSCPTSTSYRLKVSRGTDFLYLTRGLTKKIRVDKVDLVVTWGNLELAFANSEELGIFVSALRYVDFVEDKDKAAQAPSTTSKSATSKSSSSSGSFNRNGKQLYQWVLPLSITVAVVATLSYHVLKRRSQ